MKKLLAVALVSLSSSAFSMSNPFIQNRITELEMTISKAESIFGDACKEATDGYNSCMKRLAGFDYSMAIIDLPSLKKELASKIKAEKVAKAEMAELSKGIVCSNKKGYAAIGMTSKEVIVCGWGKPDRINKTTTAYGTTQQWVYRTRIEGYLYFDSNGILTSMSH